jgi:hypothetical protein
VIQAAVLTCGGFVFSDAGFSVSPLYFQRRSFSVGAAEASTGGEIGVSSHGRHEWHLLRQSQVKPHEIRGMKCKNWSIAYAEL